MSNKHPAGSEQPFRPPMISLAVSAAWSYVSYQLYLTGQSGQDWATAGCLGTGALAIGQVIRALNDYSKLLRLKRQQEQFKKAGKRHGESRWATKKDLDKSQLFSTDEGIFLGTIQTGKHSAQDVFYNGEASISIIAPPGENKTMSILIPSILENLGHSMIVNDNSAEILSICGPALTKAGFETQVLTPYPKQVSDITGLDVTDAGLDIFSSFDPTMDPRNVRSEILTRMKWIMPGKADMEEKSAYFYRYGRLIGGFLAMRQIVQGNRPSLPAIRKDLMEGPGFLQELFEEAEGSTAFGGVYEELARSLSGVLTTAPLQFMGGYGIAEQAFDIYDHYSAMGKHASGSSFDPRTLKDPNKKIAVFVISTLDKMQTHAASIAMTLTYLFETIASDHQQGEVTALIDEAGGLVMPKLADSLLFYRKSGLRCVLVWQDLEGQAEKKYGKAGMRQIMSASMLKVAMGIQSPETLEMLSKLCGTESLEDVSLNDRSILSTRMPDLSQGQSHRGIPLIRPEEIRTMDRNQLLVIGGNLPPIKLNKVCYWERAKWRKIAGPSPYYHG